MRTKQRIAMSTMFTNQAIHTKKVMEIAPGTTSTEYSWPTWYHWVRGRWRGLSGLIGFLVLLLVHNTLKAQTFCAPDATAYYTFEQTFQDRSGYEDGYSGTEDVVNTTSRPTFSAQVNAKVGLASARFNGTSQYLRYDDAVSGYLRSGLSNFSVMFWFKPLSPGTGLQTLFEVGNATDGYGIRLNNGTLQARINTTAGSTGTVSLNGGTISDTDWHHVAFTFEGNNPSPSQRVKLYLDGIVVGTVSMTQTAISANTDASGMGATLGRDVWGQNFGANTPGNFYNGFIDDFVYSYGASVAEVTGNYVFTQATITNYLNCLTAFPTNTLSCDGGVYISQSQSSTLGSSLKQFNYASSGFDDIDVNTSIQYNAIGYNQVDNFLYGIRYPSAGEDAANRSATLVRIGADGRITDLGYVTGLNTDKRNFVIGDIDPSGIYYLHGDSNTSLTKINLTATPPYSATSIVYSNPQNLGSDWAYNPLDNFLYTVTNGTGVIKKINPVTAAVETITPVNGTIPSGGAYGALWFDQYRNLYVYDNSGVLYRYNLPANTWSTITTQAPTVALNDGAACPVIKAEPAIAKQLRSQSGNTATFDITVSNTGPASAADVNVRDVLPAGLVFQSAQVLDAGNAALPTTDYSLATPAVGANGTVLFKINNLNVGTNNRIVLRLTVRTASGVCEQTFNNCTEIVSAFGVNFNNGDLTTPSDNVMAIPGDVTSNNDACAPVSFSLTPPAPTAIASASATCSGDLFTITYGNIPVGGTIVWNRMPGNVSMAGNVSEALSNTTTSPISYTYTAVVQNAYNCPSPSVVTVVTVNPVPIVTPSQCSQTICSGETGNITFVSSIPGSTIHWLRVEDNLAGTGDISEVMTTAGNFTYKIWVTSPAPASCPSSTTITCEVVVNNCCDLVASVDPVSVTNCTATTGGLVITYTGSQTYQYNLNGGAFLPLGVSPFTVSNLAPGSYTVVVQAVGDPTCTTVLTGLVEINPISVHATSNSPQCAGNTILLEAIVSDGVAGVFQWSGPNGFSSTGQSVSLPNATSLASGTYTVVLTDALGCSASATTAVVISSQPSLTLTAGSGQTICSGQSTTINVGGSNGAAVTWANSFGQSGTGTSIVVAGIENVSSVPQSITYVVNANAGSCSDQATYVLTINPTPIIQVIPTAAVYCDIEQVSLTANVFPNTATINWTRTPATPSPPATSGSGTGTVTIQHTLPAAAYTYIFSAAGTNGCTSQPVQVPVTVQQ